MWRWLLVLGVMACGRIGFDPTGEATGSNGSNGSNGANGEAGMSGACDQGACAAAGGMCSGGQCVIDVTGVGPITCPPGEDCVINCNATDSCRGGIDCSQASHCTIDCKAIFTCMNVIMCQGGGCDVYCRTDNTCDTMQFTCGGMPCDVQCCNGGNAQCSGVGGAMLHLPGTCP